MSTRHGAVGILLGLALLLGWSREGTSAVTYLGEACWVATVTEDETGPGIGNTLLFRFGITQMGGPYYSFQGTRIITNPAQGSLPRNPVFLAGGAVVSGNEVIFDGHSTYDGNPNYATRSARSFQLKVNLSDLNGTFWSNSTDFNTTARTFTDHYNTGPATFSTCP
jgi:hypothetical protein